MKILLYTLMLCLITLLAHAKSNDSLRTKKEYRSEAGLIIPVYSDVLYNNSEMLLFGVQYKRWLRPNLGIRLIGAWGLYNGEHEKRTGTFGDTFTYSRVHTQGDFLVIGAGAEAQKEILKHLYIFAVTELKLAYGSGNSWEGIERSYPDKTRDQFYQVQDPGRGYHEHRMSYISISPGIGAKVQLKRLAAGLEFHPLEFNYQYISNAIDRGSFVSRATITQRLFINYRF